MSSIRRAITLFFSSFCFVFLFVFLSIFLFSIILVISSFVECMPGESSPSFPPNRVCVCVPGWGGGGGVRARVCE